MTICNLFVLCGAILTSSAIDYDKQKGRRATALSEKSSFACVSWIFSGRFGEFNRSYSK